MAQPDGTPPTQQNRSDWKSLHLWQIQGVRDVLVILGVFGLLWLGQKISVVTVPLLLAILLAYLFEPVIRWLMRKASWSRQASVSAVMIAAILVVILPAALGLTFGVAQSIRLVENVAGNIDSTYAAVMKGEELEKAQADLRALETEPPPDGPASPDPAIDGGAEPATGGTPQPTDPEAVAAARARVAVVEAEYARVLSAVEGSSYRHVAEYLYAQDGNTIEAAFFTVRQWVTANAREIATAGAGALATTLGFLGGLFSLLFMGFITAFFFFFIATGWVELQRFGDRVLPEKHRARTIDLLTKFDAVISAFVRGRLTIAFIQSIVFTLGYFVIGVPAAFVLGPLVAVLSIVPYLALVGVPISIVLLALEGYDGFRGQWWWILGAPTAFYFVAQALDDYVWTPMIQGKSTDMSTPMILFASLAGGVLFGVFGLLIAIPIAACLKILVQEIFWPRFKALSLIHI